MGRRITARQCQRPRRDREKSPDVPRWTVVADTYHEAHQLAEEGVRLALERDDLAVEHYVPAGVAVAA
jgi:hypothetical protein